MQKYSTIKFASNPSKSATWMHLGSPSISGGSDVMRL